MITLIICKCQSDFIAGTMYKKSTKNILPKIKDYIKEHKKEISQVIFTVDWHPYNHCSFKRNGGTLPQHCIQDTPGACIEPKLLKYVQSLNIPYQVDRLSAFEELEEDGAFNEIELIQDAVGSRYYFDSIIEANADDNFVICGLNGDCDIINTIKNMLNAQIEPSILIQGIASTDNGETLAKFIKEFGINKI